MADNEQYQWRQVQPGRYERETDVPEQFYHAIARLFKGTGHVFFAIVAVLEFSVEGDSIDESVVTDAFKYAWQRLRFQFPTIASRVVYDTATETCLKTYEVPQSERDVERWLESTMTFEFGTRTAKDLAQEDTTLGEYARLHLFKSQNLDATESTRWSLLFRSHHDIADGMGTFKILDHLFAFAAEYVGNPSTVQRIHFGEEVGRLSLPLQIQANIPQPTERQLATLNAVKVLNDINRAERPILCYPGEVTASISGKSQQIGTKMSLGDSSCVLGACKFYGFTATHIFHAAIGLVLRDLQPRTDKDELKRYMTYALVDLRKSCPNSEQHPASILHTVSTQHLVLDLVVLAASEVSVEARQEELLCAVNTVRDYYKSIVVDQDFLAVVPTILAPPPFTEDTPPIPTPADNRTVSLSSLGLMDSLLKPKHGPFQINDPWVIGAEYGTGLGLFLGTFAGEIHVWAGYNEAFHKESDVKEYLDLVCQNALRIVDAMEASASVGHQ